MARLTASGRAASDLCARMTSTASRTWAQRPRPTSLWLSALELFPEGDLMQNSWKIAALFTVGALSIASGGRAQSSFDLKSPDKHIEVRIRTAQGVRYDVVLNGRAILENCSLSLDVDHKTFGKDATKILHAKERSHDETIEPVVRQKFAKIRDHYNEVHLEMEGGYAVTFRAYNEGVAYRLETSLAQQQVKVYAEEMNLNFSANDMVFYPQEDSFMSQDRKSVV